MKLKFDVSLDEYKIINAILNEHLAPRCLVFVFGSRAKNTARFNSDLDLAIASDKPLTQKEMVMLKDAFNESRLPYKVDVVDMHNIEKSFRDIIDSQKVVFPLSRSLSGVEGKGNVPELRFPEFSGEWGLQRLGELTSKIGSGSTPSGGEKVYLSEGIIFIRSQNIFNNTLDLNSSTYISEDTHCTMKGSSVKSKDVLLNITGASIGRSCVVPKDFIEGNVNQHVCIIRPLKILASEFLQLVLSSSKGQKLIFQGQTGSGREGLNFQSIALFKIALPSLPEQQKIADFLTSVDNKIQSLTQKKEALTQYKKSLLQKLFPPSTGSGAKSVPQLRFPGFASTGSATGWVEKRLGEVCDVRRGASPRPITSPKWFRNNSEIGWVRISDVTKSNKYLLKTEQYLSEEGIEKSRFVEKGNLIMSICATIGKPIYTGFPVCIHDGFVVFENLKECHEFVYYFLEKIQAKWYRYGQPGTQVNLNSDIVSNEKMYLPSLPEQQKIANFLTEIDNKITQVDQQIETMTQFKKGLLQQMFV